MIKILSDESGFLKFLVLIGLFLNTTSYAQNKDIAEQLISNTIKIQGYKNLPSNSSGTGTGFFMTMKVHGILTPVIVTNTHVIKGFAKGILKFNNEPNYGDIITVSLLNFEKLWIEHPSEDLAILPLATIQDLVKRKYNREIYIKAFSDSNILTKEQENTFTAIEEVFMVGYPKGFYDSLNNLPIVRKGITATPLFLNYNKQDQFLLDIPIYPGSSGSPVVIFNNGVYVDKKSGSLIIGSRFYFVGIADESKEYSAKGTTNKINGKAIETTTWLPFGIAVAIKAYKLFYFEPKLEQLLANPGYINLLNHNITISY
jgi:hypothetical protein